ncbi:MAG TPA: NRDE family protein, partial [Acidimicrobiales bacterium]|nr:NRDE family protein [Acidimicrobiales bacterium]
GSVDGMCLLVVASRVDADEPLIVGANRDEVLDRPTTPMTVLEKGPPRIVGGRDELSGGTWLAVNQHGVCAGLTNQPLGDARDPSKRSRGELPLALARRRSAPEAVEAFVEEFRPQDFNGAWLLVGDRSSLFFVDFTGDRAMAQALEPGIHVLENSAADEPSPKVDLVRATLGQPEGADETVLAFRRVLADHRIPEGDDRPNAANCVHLEGFGTRSSCLVRVPAVGLPQLWVAPGPPCFAAYDRVRNPWVDT